MENKKKIDAPYRFSLLESSLDSLMTITQFGQIMDVNAASMHLTGMDREKLIGSDFSRYFTIPERAIQFYQQVIETKNVFDYPLTIKHSRGTFIDVVYRASVYTDSLGNIQGIFATATKVEEHKWAKDLQIANKKLAVQDKEKDIRSAELIIAHKKLAIQGKEKSKLKEELIIANYTRSLIEASRDPLFTISIEGDITDTNEASVIVTEVSREKLIGTKFNMYFTEPDKAEIGYQEVFAKGFVVDFPLTIKDGKLSNVLFNGSVYKDKDGQVIGAVVVARDITEQKKLEKEYTEAKIFAELATEIAEEAKTKAESATFIAENAVKAKQQFLSNMSHEIRTPMNAIIGFTKVLLKTELTLKQKEYLMAIKMSGDALIVLINDILDLAKVDSGKMTFEEIPFRMELSISAMLHLFETKIQEKNLELEINYDRNIPNVLLGDSVRLHQIIINLISNAVKFTYQGKITMSVQLLKENEEKVTLTFSVKDTGIGIPLSKLDKIFENFQQASSGTSRLYGGTGLGLAIVKQLVESQGGHILVESEEGVGSNFSFTLDFKKTPAHVQMDHPVLEINNDKKDIKILVVEDIILNQLLMKTLLDDFGMESDIAANGKIAIAKLNSKSYDLILMDLQMPEMNGFEATEYIRKIIKLTIPIIALTADVTTVDLAKCKAVGMNDYISKPVDERLLHDKILSYIKKPIPLSELSTTPKTYVKRLINRCTNLDYLHLRTKANPVLISEIIQAYLIQTPLLMKEMKEQFNKRDWKALRAAVHKMIPSFSIMGIPANYEIIARDIEEYAAMQEESSTIYVLIDQLETICLQACKELELELEIIKKTNYE